MTSPDENDDEWNECKEPRGMPLVEAGADVLAALLIGGILAGIFYTFGI